MRLAALALGALALTALALAGAAAASEERPTLLELEREVVCPTCETTLDQSSSPVATRMRVFIRERIAAGDTKSEIKAALVDEFGERVLASPPKRGFNLLAWVLPGAGLALGAVALAFAAWRWSRARAPSATPAGAVPLDAELDRRVDEELARFDG